MKIGFIGLGIMGKPMVRNLIKGGYSVTVHDINAASVAELTSAGATAGGSSLDTAAQSDVIITMLPDGPDVEEAVLGENGILEGARTGSIVVDMSSISPLVSQKIAEHLPCERCRFYRRSCQRRRAESRRRHSDHHGRRRSENIRQVEPILQKMGSSVTLTGPVGAGNTTKLANQIMVACNIAAMGEALVLATRAGLNPEVVFNAVKGGLAGSTVLNAKAPMVIARNFKPGFRIELHEKDLRNALLAGESMKVSLPLTSLVQQMLISLINEGKGGLDHSAIVNFVEDMAGIEVKPHTA